MTFTIWKFIHLTAVIVLLGNLSTGFFWKFHGERYRDHRILKATYEGLHRSDFWITNICIGFIMVSGVAMSYFMGLDVLFESWMLLSFLMMGVSLVAYLVKLVPLHKAIIEHLGSQKEFAAREWSEYGVLRKSWFKWAFVATSAPFLAMALMYFRPAF